MTDAYTPRAGSTAFVALEQLRALGPMDEDALAAAIDRPTAEVLQLMSWAIKMGAIRREKINGVWWYMDGAVVPPLAVEERRAPQIVVPEAGPAPTPAATPAEPPKSPVEPPADHFGCALFNDGRLLLEMDGETVIIGAERTRALLHYLDRIAEPAA